MENLAVLVVRFHVDRLISAELPAVPSRAVLEVKARAIRGEIDRRNVAETQIARDAPAQEAGRDLREATVAKSAQEARSSPTARFFGKADDPYEVLDTFFDMGGNFIDTSNIYQEEASEKVIGEWIEKRKNRDQIVLATKYTAGYRAYQRETEPIQANFTGNSRKSMHVSVNASLKKLKTDYIDILYVHWQVNSTPGE